MNFCTKCGRQLADGEVCTCQQTVQPQINPAAAQPQVNQAAGQQSQATTQQFQGAGQPQGAPQPQFNPQGAPQMNNASKAAGSNSSFISELGILFKGLIKKPVEAVSEYVEKSSIMASAVLVGVLAFLSAVAQLFYMIERNVDTKVSASKYYNPLIPSTWVVEYPYSILEIVFRFVCTLLFNIILSVLFAAMIYLLVKFLFEKDSKITMAQALAVSSVRSLIYIPLNVFASAIGIIPVGIFDTIGGWITSFGSAFSIVLLIMAIRTVLKDKNRMPWVYAITMIVVSVISTFLNTIESALAGLM